MTLNFISRDSSPTYTALSTDVVAGKITGATIKGGTVYFTDTDVWKIIESDLTLGEYALPGTSTAGYTEQSQTSKEQNIVKGVINTIKIRPKIQNEHSEPSGEALETVDVATSLGQFFKASQPNINGINLTAQSAATFASMDAITSGGGENKAGTMEYSDDAALQAEYVKTGAVEAVRSAFTDLSAITQDGSYACKIPTTTATDSWVVTLTSTDLTGVTFSLKFAQTNTYNKAKVAFFVGDGTNTKSFQLSVGEKNIWQTFVFAEGAMSVETEDATATTPNMSAITKMGFRIDDADVSNFGYADSITYQAEGGSFALELWDFGTSLPVGTGTVDYTVAGTQYTELGDRGINGGVVSSLNIQLLGGKRKYHIPKFIAGTASEHPDNTLLTVGNYYGIVAKYVDTDVTLYGADTTYEVDFYENGYAWKAEVADDLIDKIQGATGAGAYSDFMFQVFSTQDVYITKGNLLLDSTPGENSELTMYTENSDKKIIHVLSTLQAGGYGRTERSITTTLRPAFLDRGGKFEAYYNDDPTDSVSKALLVVDYIYIPPTING